MDSGRFYGRFIVCALSRATRRTRTRNPSSQQWHLSRLCLLRLFVDHKRAKAKKWRQNACEPCVLGRSRGSADIYVKDMLKSHGIFNALFC